MECNICFEESDVLFSCKQCKQKVCCDKCYVNLLTIENEKFIFVCPLCRNIIKYETRAPQVQNVIREIPTSVDESQSSERPMESSNVRCMTVSLMLCCVINTTLILTGFYT